MFSKIKNVSFISLLAVSFVIMSCNDTTMTDIPAENEIETLGMDMQPNQTILDDVFVAGRTISGIDELTVTDTEGNILGEFTGRIVNLQLTEGNEPGEILASGRFIGTLNGERINQAFDNLSLGVFQLIDGVLTPIQELLDDLLDGENGTCPILFLDIGPIFVDLLGLEIAIDPIVVEIVAQRGPGNLLGNLLCGLLGILD